MNCCGCQELLITPRQRAANCKECIEQYLNDKFEISQGNEVLVEKIAAWFIGIIHPHAWNSGINDFISFNGNHNTKNCKFLLSTMLPEFGNIVTKDFYHTLTF